MSAANGIATKVAVTTHASWAARGFGASILPIIPVGAVLSPGSAVDPGQIGKVPGDKGPHGWRSFGWRKHRADDADLARWSAQGAGVGLQARDFPGLDIDVLDKRVSDLVAALAIRVLGAAPVRIGRAPKQLLAYRTATPFPKRRYAFRLPDGGDHAVELLGDGQFYVVEGVHPGTGKPYDWPAGLPEAASLVEITAEMADAFFDQLETQLDMLGATPLKRATDSTSNPHDVNQAALVAPSAALLAEALEALPNDGGYDEWVACLCAIRAAAQGILDDEGYELAEEWTGRWGGGGSGAPIALENKWPQLKPPFVNGWPWVELRARGAGWIGSAIADFAGIQRPAASRPGLSGTQLAKAAYGDPVAFSADGRVVVHYRAHEMHLIADNVRELMLRDKDRAPLFNFGGGLASVQPASPRTSRELSRNAGALGSVVARPDKHALRKRMMESCCFVIHGHGKPKEASPPMDLVEMVISRRGHGMPVLTGIVAAPTLREDGSLVSAPGYDAATGLWLDFDVSRFPGLKERPDRTNAVAAVALLRNTVFEGFPFASDADESVAMAALLTGLVSRTCGPAPLFLFTAPVQGSGKTALAELITQLAFGSGASPQPWPHEEAEREKTLLASLRDGSAAALFDNIPDGAVIDSAALARAISGETFKARVLGVSTAADVPANALWLATGNNVRPAGDLATRTLVCNVDARVERPDQRSHRRGDLAAWAAAHRPMVVEAGLAILRGYVLSGQPSALEVRSRFPDWDRLVRAALAWSAGRDAISAKLKAAYAEDPADAARHRLFLAWQKVFGDGEVSPAEVVQLTSEAISDFDTGGDRYDLKAALVALGGIPARGVVTREWVGRTLSKIAGRIIGELRLSRWMDPVSRSARYRLMKS